MYVYNQSNLVSLTRLLGENLAPLELIHSNLCEMNGELTKGRQSHFWIVRNLANFSGNLIKKNIINMFVTSDICICDLNVISI